MRPRSANPRPTRDPHDEEQDASSGAIPDILRKAMAVGFSGFFTTEEAIRKALGDTLPKDWVDFATEQSERTRSEVTQRLSEEFGKVLEKVDLAEVLESLLSGRTLEVRAQIRLGERGSDSTVRVKEARGATQDTAADADHGVDVNGDQKGKRR